MCTKCYRYTWTYSAGGFHKYLLIALGKCYSKHHFEACQAEVLVTACFKSCNKAKKLKCIFYIGDGRVKCIHNFYAPFPFHVTAYSRHLLFPPLSCWLHSTANSLIHVQFFCSPVFTIRKSKGPFPCFSACTLPSNILHLSPSFKIFVAGLLVLIEPFFPPSFLA